MATLALRTPTTSHTSASELEQASQAWIAKTREVDGYVPSDIDSIKKTLRANRPHCWNPRVPARPTLPAVRTSLPHAKDTGDLSPGAMLPSPISDKLPAVNGDSAASSQESQAGQPKQAEQLPTWTWEDRRDVNKPVTVNDDVVRDPNLTNGWDNEGINKMLEALPKKRERPAVQYGT